MIEITERPVQPRGSAFARWCLRVAGWRLCFDGLPAAQGVLVVYPHTSNWDFPIGLLAKWGIGLQASFWAKDSLFRVPLLGAWMRWLGGVAVDRSGARGLVGGTIDQLQAAARAGRFMWLALAPEGTRGRTEGWRSGFYRVALGADVPVGLVFFDYARREVGMDSYWRLSGDIAADFVTFAQRLGHRQGRRPQMASPIKLI